MDKLFWKGIAIGAVVAASINLGAGFLFPTSNGGPLDPATIASVIVSFLAYGLGGYIAGRMAGQSGGLNGLMVAVIGFVVGIVLGVIVGVVIAATGNSFSQQDSSSINVAAVLAVAGASLALTFVGGYVGGKIGERSSTASERLGVAPLLKELYSKITVRLPSTRMRSPRCQRTARARTRRSISRP